MDVTDWFHDSQVHPVENEEDDWSRDNWDQHCLVGSEEGVECHDNWDWDHPAGSEEGVECHDNWDWDHPAGSEEGDWSRDNWDWDHPGENEEGDYPRNAPGSPLVVVASNCVSSVRYSGRVGHPERDIQVYQSDVVHPQNTDVVGNRQSVKKDETIQRFPGMIHRAGGSVAAGICHRLELAAPGVEPER